MCIDLKGTDSQILRYQINTISHVALIPIALTTVVPSNYQTIKTNFIYFFSRFCTHLICIRSSVFWLIQRKFV